RCLTFIIPRPKVTRNIINVCTDRFLADGPHWFKENITFFNESRETLPVRLRRLHSCVVRSKETFAAMSSACSENIEIIDEHLGKYIVDIILNRSEEEAALALQIGLFAFPLKVKIFTKCINRLLMLYPNYLWLCYEAVDKGMLHIIDLV